MKAYACNFVLDAFCNGKPVQFLQEGCRVAMMRCHENKSQGRVLNFLEGG